MNSKEKLLIIAFALIVGYSFKTIHDYNSRQEERVMMLTKILAEMNLRFYYMEQKNKNIDKCTYETY